MKKRPGVNPRRRNRVPLPPDLPAVYYPSSCPLGLLRVLRGFAFPGKFSLFRFLPRSLDVDRGQVIHMLLDDVGRTHFHKEPQAPKDDARVAQSPSEGATATT